MTGALLNILIRVAPKIRNGWFPHGSSLAGVPQNVPGCASVESFLHQLKK